MKHKEYRKETHQSILTFKKGTVEKRYFKKHEKNHLSSVKNEMYCLNKFSSGNNYGVEVISVDKNSYIMKRYDFSLGNTKRISEPNIRRLLFSCSLKQVLKQLNEIQNILNEKQITHKDINPGNFLYSESERQLRLTDFYWASTENINTEFVKGINGIYKEDSAAFAKIRKQITAIHKRVSNDVEQSKEILKRLGKPYYDGSAKHKGKTYHPIDIHYYKGNEFHKNIDYEFNNISNNINGDIHSMIDIGCAAGYYLFNLTRKYQMEKAIGFEADPNMLTFLKTAALMFHLNEIELNSNVDFKTVFPDVDLAICMNVHMWLVKQFGKKADLIVSHLIRHSKEMFFQTCHAESSGMYKVAWLKSKQDIQDYLEKLGGKKVTYIDSSKRGGKRYLFKIGDI